MIGPIGHQKWVGIIYHQGAELIDAKGAAISPGSDMRKENWARRTETHRQGHDQKQGRKHHQQWHGQGQVKEPFTVATIDVHQ